MASTRAAPVQGRDTFTQEAAVTTPDTSSLLVTHMVLKHKIDTNGESEFTAEFSNATGGEPSIVEILGMLELAKASALMGDGCDCTDVDDD